ncbi:MULTISPECIES: DNA cytosine methyltransferase [unclassified Variovorax]|uniref:DNA cytosine methyltransferase n=1 Tax=unclassified Variovorax TaxID=663243 RepID=UPI00076DA004|nr:MULTISPECIES: DNA cytosine methyltransferase [unclassified Variovorax]KWT70839.1 hypothetical protein APY03_6595 [Variovorax sp. WDL1]PNG49206.1 hypothetical protein CHC06_06443 [Variovorax sp. B2]PNG49591.1 hypothetical protein CHC07_06500 [Variovorax sp. B4]VTV18742.1 hypothetical protein WDL1P2_00397 [Variovorax sp. WDL1]
MYLASDELAVPSLASFRTSGACATKNLFPEADVAILVDDDGFPDALRPSLHDKAAANGQARGDSMRHEGTFRPRIKQVSLPRTSSKSPIPKGLPFISPATAAAQLAAWKAEAARQGCGEVAGRNACRTVISLFDASGVLAQPWVDAGYNVITYDLQTGGDISQFDAENLLEQHGNDDVWAILAQPPCTDFASSGAQWWKEKDEDGRTEASIELVRQTLRTIELFRPPVWVMENPVGRIREQNKLPAPLLKFDPWHFGDSYTKRTELYGNFNNELPLAPVEPIEGSKMHRLSSSAKFERSLTPEGFAYAFFMANNAESFDPIERMAREFPGVNVALLRAAAGAGNTEEQIRNQIEDAFYDSDLEWVHEVLEGLAVA